MTADDDVCLELISRLDRRLSSDAATLVTQPLQKDDAAVRGERRYPAKTMVGNGEASTETLDIVSVDTPMVTDPDEGRTHSRRARLSSAAGAVFGQARRSAVATFATAIGLLYPPVCVACRAATGDAQALCASCWGGIGFIERPFCERLGTPFEIDLGPGALSPAAIADPPVFARARAVCRFDGAARDLVHRLKYGDRAELSLTLGRMMRQSGHELLTDAALIVPVPLHRTRLWSRRFNQAALLAQTLGKLSGKPHAPAALARVKRTRQQVGLSKAQRADNLQGAFRVLTSARAQVEGRRILLVDDVLTTGATVNAASRALLRAGATAVDVLTFARVVTDR